MKSGTRMFLHRRAAQALERAAAPQTERVAGQLFDHYLAAGEPIRAADYAEQAAAQALAVGSFVEAASYARRAIDGRLGLGLATQIEGKHAHHLVS